MEDHMKIKVKDIIFNGPNESNDGSIEIHSEYQGKDKVLRIIKFKDGVIHSDKLMCECCHDDLVEQLMEYIFHKSILTRAPKEDCHE